MKPILTTLINPTTTITKPFRHTSGIRKHCKRRITNGATTMNNQHIYFFLLLTAPRCGFSCITGGNGGGGINTFFDFNFFFLLKGAA